MADGQNNAEDAAREKAWRDDRESARGMEIKTVRDEREAGRLTMAKEGKVIIKEPIKGAAVNRTIELQVGIIGGGNEIWPETVGANPLKTSSGEVFRFGASEYPRRVYASTHHYDVGAYVVKNHHGAAMDAYLGVQAEDGGGKIDILGPFHWEINDDDAKMQDASGRSDAWVDIAEAVGRAYMGKRVVLYLHNSGGWGRAGGMRNVLYVKFETEGTVPDITIEFVNRQQSIIQPPGFVHIYYYGNVTKPVRSIIVIYNDTTDGHWQDEWQLFAEVPVTDSRFGEVELLTNPTRGHYRRFCAQFRYTDGSTSQYATTTYPLCRTNMLPNAPTGISRTPDIYENGKITLSYRAGEITTSGIAGYEISHSVYKTGESPKTWVTDGMYTGMSVQFTPSMVRGDYIQYRIRAKDTCGEFSGYVYFATVRKNMLPKAPEWVKVTPDIFARDVTVDWLIPPVTTSNIHHYRLEVAVANTPSFSNFQFVADTGSAGQFTPPSTAGQYVQYRVKTVDVLGAESGYTYSNVVRMNTPPTKPGRPSVTPKVYVSGEFALSWAASGDEMGNIAGYIVYARLNDAAETVTVGKCRENKYSFTPEWGIGTRIRFSVQAYDSLGAVSPISEESDEAIIKPESAAPWFIVPEEERASLSKRPAFRIGWEASQIGAEIAIECRVVDERGAVVIDWAEVLRKRTEVEGTARVPGEIGNGRYTCEMRVNDGYAPGKAAAMAFRVERPEWTREIESGAVIADENISHQADIRQMVEMANKARARAGLDAKELTDEVGLWANWQKNMAELVRMVNEACARIGIAQGAEVKNAYPSAESVNRVRGLTESV